MNTTTTPKRPFWLKCLFFPFWLVLALCTAIACTCDIAWEDLKEYWRS